MILNSKRREELRSFISEEVVRVPKGQRIHLDKNLLEELLFEVVVLKEQYSNKYKENSIIKVPVWSGEFLSKIDLSEISFKGVCFDGVFLEGNHVAPVHWIIYKNTNALINLDDIYKNTNIVSCCNFSGTKVVGKVGDCFVSDLSNCGLTAENFDLDYLSERGGRIETTNFANNDLRGLNIETMDLLIPNDEDRVFMTPNSFENTGISLTDDAFSEFTEFLDEYSLLSSKDLASAEFCIRGCYIDGKLYNFQKEGKSLTAQNLRKYEKDALDDIKRQEWVDQQSAEFLKEKISSQVNSLKKSRVRK